MLCTLYCRYEEFGFLIFFILFFLYFIGAAINPINAVIRTEIQALEKKLEKFCTIQSKLLYSYFYRNLVEF